MAKYGFFGGVGLGVLAGTALGITLSAKHPETVQNMQHAAKQAAHRVEQMKDDLTNTIGM